MCDGGAMESKEIWAQSRRHIKYCRDPPNIRLGYVCINIELRLAGIYTGRTMINRIIEEMHKKERYSGGDELIARARANLQDLARILLWNWYCGVGFYRISSDICPHATNRDNIKYIQPRLRGRDTIYNLGNFRKEFDVIGEIVARTGQRVTFHTLPYTVLGSRDATVLKKSVADVTYLSAMLDAIHTGARAWTTAHKKHPTRTETPIITQYTKEILKYTPTGKRGCPSSLPRRPHPNWSASSSVIVCHIGGIYEGVCPTQKRWIAQWRKLPANVRRRLALENTETCGSAEELLPLCERWGIPFVFDLFHWRFNNAGIPISELARRAVATWSRHGGRPKFHISDQMPNSPAGAHSYYVTRIPHELLELPLKIDIMVEAKAKELALFRLRAWYWK